MTTSPLQLGDQNSSKLFERQKERRKLVDHPTDRFNGEIESSKRYFSGKNKDEN